jgi:hypothetical protein
MIFVPLFLYNPISSKVLLLLFRGVYFRFAYLFPFPLVVGVVVSVLAERRLRAYKMIWSVVCAISVGLALIVPTSIFRSDRFAWVAWYDLKEYALARELVRVAPEGLMLAPFPVSGAVATLDANYPQMLTRVDTLQVFLALQGQPADGALRSAVDGFLQDNNDSLAAFLQLLANYPEIRSIVMRNAVYLRYKPDIDSHLHSAQTQQMGGWRVFWK